MSVKAQIRRSTLACAALFAIYFVAPVDFEDGPVVAAVRIGSALAAFIVLILAVKRLIRRQLDDPSAPLGGLVVAIVAGVLLFALADYCVAYWMPGEFTGLHTRLDALYYALTTLLTVGFGDISATGQLARGLLCFQMAFNIVVIAGSASFLARQVTARAQRHRAR